MISNGKIKGLAGYCRVANSMRHPATYRTLAALTKKSRNTQANPL
jgi:hypothetical protein